MRVPRIFHPEPLTVNSTVSLSDDAFQHTIKVLRMQDEEGDLWTLSDGMGTVNGPLVFALFAQWLLVFFCIYNLTKTPTIFFLCRL